MKQRKQRGTLQSNRNYLSRFLSATTVLLFVGLIAFFTKKDIGIVAIEDIPNKYEVVAKGIGSLAILIAFLLVPIWGYRSLASSKEEDATREIVKIFKTVCCSGLTIFLSRRIPLVATYLEAFWGALNQLERNVIICVSVFCILSLFLSSWINRRHDEEKCEAGSK